MTFDRIPERPPALLDRYGAVLNLPLCALAAVEFIVTGAALWIILFVLNARMIGHYRTGSEVNRFDLAGVALSFAVLVLP